MCRRCAAASPLARALPNKNDGQKHQRAGGEAHAGVAERVHLARDDREAGEQGIGREGEDRHDDEEGNARAQKPMPRTRLATPTPATSAIASLPVSSMAAATTGAAIQPAGPPFTASGMMVAANRASGSAFKAAAKARRQRETSHDPIARDAQEHRHQSHCGYCDIRCRVQDDAHRGALARGPTNAATTAPVIAPMGMNQKPSMAKLAADPAAAPTTNGR